MVCPKDLRSIGVSTTKNCPLLDLEPTKTSPCTLEVQHRRQVGDFGVSECGQSDESGAAKTTPRVVRGPQGKKGRDGHGNLGEKHRKPPEIYLTEYISFHVETNSMQELVYIVMSHIYIYRIQKTSPKKGILCSHSEHFGTTTGVNDFNSSGGKHSLSCTRAL